MTAAAWVLTAGGALLLLRLLLPYAVRPRTAPDPAPACLPAVSVLVRAGADEAATLADAVRSIRAGGYPWVEVIVLGHGPGAAGLTRPDVTVLPDADVDAGVAAAHAEVVVATDGYTTLAPDTLTRLVAPLGDPTIGAAYGVADSADGPGRRLRRVDDAFLALDRRGCAAVGWPPVVPGTIVAYRKAALADAAGADPLLSLRRTGWRVGYVPDAGAVSRPPATLGALLDDRRTYWRRSVRAVRQLRRACVRPTGGAARRTCGYLVLTWLATLAAPVVDLAAVYGLAAADAVVLLGWLSLLAVQSAVLARALRPAWLLPAYVVAQRWLVVFALATSRRRRHLT
ncbi:MAG TPA: glycosyltransferase family 2 protein [Actinocatenispora sp.]